LDIYSKHFNKIRRFFSRIVAIQFLCWHDSPLVPAVNFKRKYPQKFVEIVGIFSDVY